MKSPPRGERTAQAASHPARGAWIEMSCPRVDMADEISRTPQGVRGLKFLSFAPIAANACVAPRKGCVD